MKVGERIIEENRATGFSIYSKYHWMKLRWEYRWRIINPNNGKITASAAEYYFNLKECRENAIDTQLRIFETFKTSL